MNLIFFFGIHIIPIERHAQKMLAIKNIGRYEGMFSIKRNVRGSMNEIRVMMVVVFFSTTITLFSYHVNLSFSASAS
ncbi:hypothetical protein [Xylanibacter caecicola]|uniref:hypothetical protein n=1 Tax=Xylanibacter caecicola TaxID=2736294 RepID=UPI002594618D|nr:hypothetical protein [Xylanibacter caecicola]